MPGSRLADGSHTIRFTRYAAWLSATAVYCCVSDWNFGRHHRQSIWCATKGHDHRATVLAMPTANQCQRTKCFRLESIFGLVFRPPAGDSLNADMNFVWGKLKTDYIHVFLYRTGGWSDDALRMHAGNLMDTNKNDMKMDKINRRLYLINCQTFCAMRIDCTNICRILL